MDNDRVTKEKIAAGIVLYNPELVRLKENIEHIIVQTDKVFLFDNGSSNIEKIEQLVGTIPGKIELLRENENKGIAAALNGLCRYAEQNEYLYIITLDHDSVCPVGLIETLMGDLSSDTAVVAPNVIYRNNESYAEHKKTVEDVEWVITSASLISLKVWKTIGGFDEKLFIDGVDRDFCLRAVRSGYRVLKDYRAELMHELGDLRCRKILGRTIYVTNHSPFRKYYMIRNVIYLDKKFGEKRRFSTIAKNICKVLFFEGDKLKKMKAIMKGIHDGRIMKLREG